VVFSWTVKYYLLIIAILFRVCLTLLVVSALIEKLRVLVGAVSKAGTIGVRGLQFKPNERGMNTTKAVPTCVVGIAFSLWLKKFGWINRRCADKNG
jgi:hypothetical protein